MENTKNRMIRFCICGILLLAMLLSLHTPSAAAATGRLTVQCKGKRSGQTVYLAGDQYALVQIARAEVSGNAIAYVTNSAFSAYDCQWAALRASEQKAKAKTLETAAKHQQRFDAVGVTDSKGRIVFENLQPGLYLLIRTKVASSNTEFSCDPTFYSVPGMKNGELQYQVEAAPKFDWMNPEKPGKLPQTGQLKWPIPILLLTGMGFFFAGFELRYGGRPEDEE